MMIIAMAALAVFVCYELIGNGGANTGHSRDELDDEQARIIARRKTS